MKYSIIVPVYNCEKYLRECVESILGQTFHDFELLLIDDGSTDGSGALADELGKTDPRIRVFHKPNGGAASARNYGLDHAQGQYALFVDGDDTLEAHTLETVERSLAENAQALVVYGMSFDYYRDRALTRSEYLCCAHEGIYETKTLIQNFRAFFQDNALSSACNKVFSMDRIRKEELRYREGMTLYEDLDFVLRYLRLVDKVLFVNKPLYHYRHDLMNPHLYTRIGDWKKLQENLSAVLGSSLMLCESAQIPFECAQMLSCTADLYMQLLRSHLMATRYSIDQLSACLTGYCSEQNFRKLLRLGVQLSCEEQKLLDQVDSGAFREIDRYYRKKRAVAAIKRKIKSLLRR